MLSNTVLAKHVEGRAAAGREGVYNAITSNVLFALNNTVFAEAGKALAVPKLNQRLGKIYVDAKVEYSTARRQIGMALRARALIATKLKTHKWILEVERADDVPAAQTAIDAFFRGMGCHSAGDIDAWSRGDGTALKTDDRKKLLQKPAKKAGAGAGGNGDESLSDVVEGHISSAGVTLEQIEQAIAFLEGKRREMMAAAASAEIEANANAHPTEEEVFAQAA